MAAFLVVRPGMLTTVQDLGRWGYQDRGVPVAGPMDLRAHRLANRLVGNDDRAAALEVTLIGPELEPDADVVCAVAGASFAVAVDGRAMPLHAAFAVPAGRRLRFGARTLGARATLAVAGGIDVPPVFGSRATSLSAGMGGVEGRALRAGDSLPIGVMRQSALMKAPGRLSPPPADGAVVRVLPGPHRDRFDRAAFDTLAASRFALAGESNRMGYRLAGPPIVSLALPELLSDATPMGSIQVLPSGQLILLMADRQTTGGYPRIATVIAADLPLTGQLAPGDWIGFAPCTRADAQAALRLREAELESGS